MTDSIDALRREVATAHAGAFALFQSIVGAFDDVIIRPRSHPTTTSVVLDMFELQAHKSITGVLLCCQHGLMEDGATLTRRLMELAVQAVYIGAESEEEQRELKAGKYIAFMWRGLPEATRRRLPTTARARWSKIARRYGPRIPRRAKSWGPNWRDMFTAIGAQEAYDQDYSYMSAIAHGRPDNQLFAYASAHIEVHDHRHVSVMLSYALKYYLMTAEQWNGAFGLVPTPVVDGLVAQAVAFRPKKRAD